MSDLIDRQAAIDAIHEDILLKPHISDSFYRENHEFVTVGYVERTLLAVPSAQVRTQMSSADCISRQAAIDAIFSEPLYESGMKKRNADAVVPAIYEKIKSLPSVQAEQKVGKWIFKDGRRIVDGYDWQCDKCGLYQRYASNYCPHCGAKMKGEEE